MGFADEVRQVIRSAIADAGSARKLAEKLGMNQSTISRWVSATRDPISDIGRLMDSLGVTLSSSPSSAGATTCPELEAEVARLNAEVRRLELALSRRDGQVDLLKEQLAEERAGRQAETAPAERKAAG